ncbi:hypothetical protein ACWDG1_46845 [Streptomyces sp. NPDC001177]
MSNERRHFDNLILLCAKDHRQIDAPETARQFDRECLEDVKRRHEDRFRRVLAALEHAEQQYVDHTRDQIVVHCSTLQRMYGGQLDEEARLGTAESVNKIADQLRRTRAARQLLCRVLEGGGELGAAEAAARGLMDGEEIRNLDRQLERLWLAHLEPPERDDGEYLPERIVVPNALHGHNPLLDNCDFSDDLKLPRARGPRERHPHRGSEQSVERAARVRDYLNGLPSPVDGVVVTEDITDHGLVEDYEIARGAMRYDAPTVVCPGNHGSRPEFRKVLLDHPGRDGRAGPVNQALRVDGLTILLCDSRIPGRHDGHLDDKTTGWSRNSPAPRGRCSSACTARRSRWACRRSTQSG